jgi:hypothetical protein
MQRIVGKWTPRLLVMATLLNGQDLAVVWCAP